MALKKTTLLLDADDVAEAKALGLRLSQICRAAVATAVRETRRGDVGKRAAAVRARLEEAGWEPPADAGEETDRAWTER